jgi:general secretion pathway protein D
MLPSFARATLALALLAACVTPAAAAPASHEPITLNFVEADIGAVGRALANLAGRELVVDPRVKGTVTLITDQAIPPELALDRFVQTIRLSGYAMVDSAGVLKIVPEADAKLQGGVVAAAVPAAGAAIATQIFPLHYENASNLVPVLRPLISPNNTINVDAGTNALVITDYADNLRRLAKVIAALDVANGTDAEVIRLHHAVAADIVPLVQRLLDGSTTTSSGGTGTPAAAPQAEGAARTVIVADPRTNALLVRAASHARVELVRAIVAKMDVPAEEGNAGNIHVVYLRNAEATRLATILRAALASNSGNTSAGAASSGSTSSVTASPFSTANNSSSSGSGSSSTSGSTASSASTASVQAAAAPSTGGQVQADPATNSLIISAPEPQYRQLRAVIDQLDGRRAQVLVESLIVEVTADKAAEFSVQWQNILGSTSSSVVGYLGSNYSVGGSNIISLNTGLSSLSTLPSTGFNIGVGRKIDGSYVLGLLARFFESSGDGNVLSTPTLLTLDNEEAKIVVGQNVPFVTGSYTSTSTSSSSSSSTVSPFQTIERKDVGITLRVKPQIAEDGTIRLTVYQEVSAVDASTENNTNGPTTNKRTIESSVLVDDGSVVVLGGLMQDEYSGSQEKVPGLSSVPVVGNLFRAETRSRKKTNLMVFLRPVVLRNAKQTNAVSADRYEMMRSVQQVDQPKATTLLPLQGAPVLPASKDTAP